MKKWMWLLAVPVLSFSGCHDDDGKEGDEWFVHANLGSDNSGTGSEFLPFRTITHAMEHAKGGHKIFVAKGTYDGSIGEVFPITVKQDVKIIGDNANKGNGSTPTFVNGGGTYTVTGGSQAATAVTAAFVMGPGCNVSGLKITVTGSSGVAAVFDGNSATLEFCTVTGCGSDGIRIFQNSAATVSNSVVSSNAGDGIKVFDTATPTIRLNSITSNGSDGVEANNTCAPDMGTVATSGTNVLQNNVGVGLNNNTTATTIQAVGNTWNASVQASSGTGTYAAGLTGGPAAAVNGNNFAITNAAAAIQF